MIERIAPIEIAARIEAAPEEVFPYFVDPALYVRWQGTEAELEPVRGGRFRVVVEHGRVALGEYLAVEPPTRVVFTWGWEGNSANPPGSSTVEITLERSGEGTVVRLRHTGLSDRPAVEIHYEGWSLYLGRLVRAAGRR